MLAAVLRHLLATKVPVCSIELLQHAALHRKHSCQDVGMADGRVSK